MRRLPLLICLLFLASPALAETAEEHLSAFIVRDLAGDGFDRLGPFIEAPEGKGGCGCSSSGNHFDIAGDPLLVADGWKITASRHPSPERAVVTVRFHLRADSRMGREAFAQGTFRRLRLQMRFLRRSYRLEKLFDGSWAVLADQEPVVSPQALAAAMERTAQASPSPRLAYYQREAATANFILRRTHKKLAD